MKVIKFVEDDILNLKDFLKVALSIFDDIDKNLFAENTKKTDEIKARNIDPAIKMLIQKVYSDSYNQFVWYDKDN